MVGYNTGSRMATLTLSFLKGKTIMLMIIGGIIIILVGLGIHGFAQQFSSIYWIGGGVILLGVLIAVAGIFKLWGPTKEEFLSMINTKKKFDD